MNRERREFLKNAARMGGLVGLSQFLPIDEAMAFLQSCPDLGTGAKPSSGSGCSGNFGNNTTSQTGYGYESGAGASKGYRVPISPACGGTILSLHFYVGYFGNGGAGIGAVYADDGTGARPSGGPLGTTSALSTVAGAGPDWLNFTGLSISFSSADYVWIFLQQESASFQYYYHSAGTGTIVTYDHGAYGSWANPFPSSGYGTETLNYIGYFTT